MQESLKPNEPKPYAVVVLDLSVHHCQRWGGGERQDKQCSSLGAQDDNQPLSIKPLFSYPVPVTKCPSSLRWQASEDFTVSRGGNFGWNYSKSPCCLPAVNPSSAPSSFFVSDGTVRAVHPSQCQLVQCKPPHRSASTANPAIHRSRKPIKGQGFGKDRDRVGSSGSFRPTLDSLMLHIIHHSARKTSIHPTDAVSSLLPQQHRVGVTVFLPPKRALLFCAIWARLMGVQSHSLVEDTARDMRTWAGADAKFSSIGLTQG